MPFDDESDDAPEGAAGFNPPLPQDDRLWRHPSEMARSRSGTTGPSGAAERPPTRQRRVGARIWAVAAMSGVAGAAFTLAILAATGTFDSKAEAPPVEQVRISVPTDPGSSEVELAAAISPSVAQLWVEGPMGTGTSTSTSTAIVIRSDGHLVTSADAVDGATQITVTFNDGQTLSGDVVGSDTEQDIAVVKVDRTDLVPVTIGVDADLQLGERTTAVSMSDASSPTPEVSVGLVSALGQRIDRPSGASMHGMIQTNIRLTESETGAPLVDSNGVVVGLVTRRGQSTPSGTTKVSSENGDGVRVRFAIPIDWAKDVADDLIDDGRVTTVWIGIRGGELTDDEVEDQGHDGARVTEVSDQSPADDAGLATGDIITRVDDTDITSMSDVIVALRDHAPGDSVAVGFQRGGEPQQALVLLAGDDVGQP